MINGTLGIIYQYRRNDFLYIGYFSAGWNDNCSRADDLFSVWIFLSHRQGILTGRHIDLQCAAEVRQRLDSRIKTGIFTFLCTAWPHPVGRQGDAVHSFCHWSPNKIGQRFGYRQYRTCSRISQGSLRSMSQRSGNTFFASIVKGNDTTVAQR